MSGSQRIGARTVDVLSGGPKPTGRLLALLDLEETPSQVAALHRDARSYGYGQCEDGLWRTASDSDEVRAALTDDRATSSAEAFFMLQHGPYAVLALSNPLAARRSLEELNAQAATQIAAVNVRLGRAVSVLREQGMSVEELEYIVFSDDMPDSVDVDLLALRRDDLVAAHNERRRRMLKRHAVLAAHQEGLSLRKIAARTGIPKSEVGRILQDDARRPSLDGAQSNS